ncbi:hypothetical protein J1N35_014652, partial [Gossypium stocksii]
KKRNMLDRKQRVRRWKAISHPGTGYNCHQQQKCWECRKLIQKHIFRYGDPAI